MADLDPGDVEAVARALWASSCADVMNRRMVNMGIWDEQGEAIHSAFRALAKAALTTLIERGWLKG